MASRAAPVPRDAALTSSGFDHSRPDRSKAEGAESRRRAQDVHATNRKEPPMDSTQIVIDEVDEADEETLIEEDDILIDEVSIDGMCGVY